MEKPKTIKFEVPPEHADFKVPNPGSYTLEWGAPVDGRYTFGKETVDLKKGEVHTFHFKESDPDLSMKVGPK